MASSTFTFRDQDGKPVWGLATRIARGHGDTNSAEDERYPDKAGHTTFLEVKKVLPSTDGHTLHINYNEGLNPDWSNYEKKSVYYSDIEDANAISIPIIIQHSGIQPPPVDKCPDPNNKQAVSEWFFKVANEVGARTNTPQNRQLMIPGFNKCGAKWQVDGSGNTRARFFLAPADTFQYTVDTGDEGSAFKLTFRY